MSPGIAGSCAQRGEAAGGGGAVEEAGEAQGGEVAPPPRLPPEPPLVGEHDLEGRAVVALLLGLRPVDLVAPADVAAVSVAEEAPEELEGEGMAARVPPGCLQLVVAPIHLEVAEVGDGGLLFEPIDPTLASRAAEVGADVPEGLAGGDEAETGVVPGEALEEGGDPLVLQLAGLRGARWVLERLETIEDEEAAVVPDEGGEARSQALPAVGSGSPKNLRASERKKSPLAWEASRVPWE